MQYDKNNIFHKIIHKEIISDFVLEGEYFIAIRDVAPKAPVHIMIIPKKEYVDMYDFVSNASPDEIIEVNKAIASIVDMMNLKEGGFKVVINAGKFGPQEIMHLHIHVMGKPSE